VLIISLRRLLFFCIVYISAYSAVAQSYSKSDFKLALVGQFIKNIEWPNTAKDNTSTDKPFIILVPVDKPMMAVLSALSGEVINRHKISVKYVATLNNLPPADLVYFSKNIDADINQAISLLRGKGTLVVTENSTSLHNVMINIIDQGADNSESYQLAFQINRPNIVYEKLIISPALILHGGSELDMADLYRETEVAMQALRGANEQSQQLLATQQQQLSQQKVNLTKLENEFTLLTTQLEANKHRLEANKQLLAEQISLLAVSSEKIIQANGEYQVAKSQSQQKLAAAEQQLVANQINVDKQLALLNGLEKQVGEKTALLLVKEQSLQTTSNKLQQKSLEVDDQAKQIDRQTNIITSSVISLGVFILASLLVTMLLFKNRKITRQLQHIVDELNATQEQLIESEKLASLGQLVAGVAHEINTPIGVVVTSSSCIGDDAKLYLRLLEEKKLKRSDIYGFLSTLVETDKLIQNNLERCSRLIQNFKQISADQVIAENRIIHLKDYINEIMGALSVVMKRKQVLWKVEGDNPEHELDPGLLGQVINNLVTNAVTHAFDEVKNKKIIINVSRADDFDQIDFIDNGNGMDEQTMLKIFEPFFTTKRGQGGTGLGMNIVYNLVTSKLNGKIAIESEVGQGTKIIMKLPR
jgi:signal transduction histidine kinase